VSPLHLHALSEGLRARSCMCHARSVFASEHFRFFSFSCDSSTLVGSRLLQGLAPVSVMRSIGTSCQEFVFAGSRLIRFLMPPGVFDLIALLTLLVDATGFHQRFSACGRESEGLSSHQIHQFVSDLIVAEDRKTTPFLHASLLHFLDSVTDGVRVKKRGVN
jgi:hypothetical protein